MSRELFFPYDEKRIQEIKDLINDRFWQSNYDEAFAIRAAMDLLENIEALTAEVDRLNLVADQAIKFGGLSVATNKGFKYILGREKFENENWCGGDSNPELYEHISLMTEKENELD